MTSEPISAFVASEPDADWESLRGEITRHVAVHAPEWTDHNASDPGITLLEVIAFGLADAHYRVFAAEFGAWPLASSAYRDASERHWHHSLPQGAGLGLLADALAGLPSDAERRVRSARSRLDALADLAADLSSTPAAVRSDVVSVLRSRLVRQCALEHADLVADVVADADRLPGSLVDRDGIAAARLADALPLWTEELDALIVRERRRLAGEALPAVDALTTQESLLAGALAPVPANLTPELLEDAGGPSLVWPPHGIQALTCEPVTDLDYAARAREHDHVLRAWAKRGRLGGIAWHGLPVADPSTLGSGDPALDWAVDPDAAAITLVVDRRPDEEDTASDDNFLRSVLRIAIGSEVTSPFPTWRDTMDPLDPRRTMCDEVGATLLRRLGVTVRATLIAAVTGDSTTLVADIRRRIETFFAEGRPESRVAAELGGIVDGPWPRHPQPALGWNPGEAIRFTEVTERIVANADVLGVEDLQLKLPGGPWVAASAGELDLPDDAIPTLAPSTCLTVVYASQGGCADA